MTLQTDIFGDTHYTPASPVNRPHEWRFARLLEIAYNPESNEGKLKADEIIKQDQRELRAGLISADDFKRTRELTLSTANGDGLYMATEFMNTVIEGAERKQIMRRALRVLPTGATIPNTTSSSPSTVVNEVAELAEFPDSDNVYSSQTVKVRKYGEKNLLSKELLDDSHYEVAALEASRAGGKLENTLNSVVLKTLLDEATEEYDTNGSNGDARALMKARKTVNTNGYDVDTAILCYDAEYEVRSNAFILDANAPRIAGMDLYSYEPVNHTYDSATYTWGYADDGNIGMTVLDSSNLSTFIGMRRDIHFVDYDDPIKDLTGAAISMRFGVSVPNPDGVCRIIR